MCYQYNSRIVLGTSFLMSVKGKERVELSSDLCPASEAVFPMTARSPYAWSRSQVS